MACSSRELTARECNLPPQDFIPNGLPARPALVALLVALRYALPGYSDWRVWVRGTGWPDHCVRYSGICFEIKFSRVCHAKGKRKKERERPSCYNYPIYPGLGPVHSMLDWIPWDLVHIQSTTAVSASFNVYTSQPAVPLRFRNNF